MIDYYEDWKNEEIVYSRGTYADKYKTDNIKKGTRKSLGLDDSREYYNKLQQIRLELIERGAIKDQCISCHSIDTYYKEQIWICNKCGESWNPQQLHYRGI